MKKTILTIVLLASLSFPQTSSIGFTGDFLTGNENLSYQAGPSLIFEYPVTKLPIAVRGNIKFYLGEVTPGKYSIGYTYTNFSAGASLNYYPINYAIEPYLGVGIYYTSNGFIGEGNKSGSTSSEGAGMTYHLIENVNNSATYELTLGIKFAASTAINFITEVTQTFNHPADVIVFYDDPHWHEVSRSPLNFNSLILKLGLLFQI